MKNQISVNHNSQIPLRDYMLFFLLSFVIILLMNKYDNISNLLIFSQFFFIALTNIISLLFLRKKSFSLFQIFHLFFLTFFCVAPYIQWQNKVTIWLNSNIFNSYDYITTLFIIIIIILIFNFTYNISFNTINQKNRFRFKYKSLNLKHEIALLGISLLVFYIVLSYNNFNFLSLLFRGGEFRNTKIIQESSLVLIIRYFIQPIGIFIFLLAKQRGVKHKVSLLFLGLLAVLSAPPTGMPRFATACLYLPVVMVYFPFLQKKNRLIILILFGLFIIFPLLNNFRRFSIGQEIDFFRNFDTMLLSGDYDAFQNLMYVIKYNIITYGEQLFGVLFFFIPRSIWTSKPIGSGFFIADKLSLNFNNISMPFFGEAFINFGFIGIILFALLLGYIVAKFDRYFWDNYKNDNFYNIYYYILIGLLFYTLRGDLINSFAYFVSFSIIYILFSKLINAITKN